MLRKSTYTREYEEETMHTVFPPWYSKYQGSLPWYLPVVLIPSKKTIGWSMVLTYGIEKG